MREFCESCSGVVQKNKRKVALTCDKSLANPKSHLGVEAFQAQTAELLRKRSIPGWVLKGPPTRQEKRDANPSATKDEIEDAHVRQGDATVT